jgi:UDP-N-acetylmuramoylalanine--D-glutamate ligase
MINSKINKFYGILGLGRTGLSAAAFMLKNQINFIAWDDNIQNRDNALQQYPNLKLMDTNDPQWLQINCLVISPGIPTSFPKAHPLAEKLQKNNIPIICDIELLYLANQSAKFVGITGTNGKSTTTKLIGHILQSNKIKNCVGGNIGTGVLSLEPLKDDGVYVIETSSFQLELLDQTHFNISVLLNITPDHLDRHNTMENYIKAKCNIFKHQSKTDCAIISVDNPITKKIYQKLKLEGRIGTIIPISTKTKIKNGISIINNHLECDIIKPLSYDLPLLTYLKGEHNAENIAASYAASLFLGLQPQDIIQAITSFQGLEHRLQFIDRYRNILFFNDSKATNAESTEKALASFPNNIYWIVGGKPKQDGIKTLATLFNRIKHAFIIGDAQEEFAKTMDNIVPYTKSGNLETAFTQATNMALQDSSTEDKIILLSPACASYDQWKDFEERGQAFCHFVYNFLDKCR